MTDSTKTKAPTYIAYHVRNHKDGEASWTRIGAAWSHGDGNGFNIQIESVPLDGRITLRSAAEQAN